MSLLDDLKAAATSAAENRGIRVLVKTNLGPAIPIYNSDSPSSGGPSLVKAGVIVTDRSGKELATYGGRPKTDWLMVSGIVLMVASAGVLMVRGLRK